MERMCRWGLNLRECTTSTPAAPRDAADAAVDERNKERPSNRPTAAVDTDRAEQPIRATVLALVEELREPANGTTHRSSRHTALRQRWVREQVEDALIEVRKIATSANVADMSMEELSPAAHRRFRAVLMGEATVDSIKLPHVTTWSVIDRASD